MTRGPFRVPGRPDGRFGRLIDRARPFSFNFDGRRMNGFAGDTVASALLANGVSVVGRSFRLHRPRGVLGIGVEEPNALVTVGRRGRKTPNLRATEVLLAPGLVVRSQNAWPTLDRDWGALADRFKPLLPPGFYYKTLKWPARLWPLFERGMRRAAGLGKAPTDPDPDRYEHLHVSADVLVVGGGLAGLSAAEAAAAEGCSVLLAEETPRLGGIADGYDGRVDGVPLLDFIRTRATALAASEGVHLLTRASVAGLYDHGLALIVERLSDDEPSTAETGTLRERLWHVRARSVVLATGAHEKPLVFSDNDRPGVMLATAARLHLRRYGVSPGRAAVIVTAGDEGYRTALDLRAAGVEVARVVDLRLDPDGPMAVIAKASGIPITIGSAPVGVSASKGGRLVQGLRVANRLTDEGPAVAREHAGDCVLMSGGWSPAAQLVGHLGGKLVFDEALGAFRPGELPPGLFVAGAANGAFDVRHALNDGWRAGAQAGSYIRGKYPRAVAPTHIVEVTRDPLAEPVAHMPDIAARADEARAFVDFQNDVTVVDMRIALAEGYGAPEHLKRYAILGLGTEQGKTGVAAAALSLAKLSGTAASDIPHTTFRPPWTPLSFGAMAGARRGALFRPVRHAPLAGRFGDAPHEPVGLWRRPIAFPLADESPEDATRREVRAVRNAVGVLDASTLGKFAVAGPDAARFLDLVLATDVADLPVGRSRYVLALDDGGFLIDDGILARLTPSRFLLSTTTAGAEKMAAWLERWRQTEWPSLRVFVTDETERWGQILVAGPRTPELVSGLPCSIRLGALPRNGAASCTLLGAPALALGSGFVGRRGLELAVPSGHLPALWDALVEAGRTLGSTPFGADALERLRLEAGQIAVGHETDGTVTPFDLGLDRFVSTRKRDFVGKHGLARADLAREGRPRLVGVLPEDPALVPAPGSHLLLQADRDPPRAVAGHVTSSGFSPTLGRGIALALVADAERHMGKILSFIVSGEVRPARVTAPRFLDTAGRRS